MPTNIADVNKPFTEPENLTKLDLAVSLQIKSQ